MKTAPLDFGKIKTVSIRDRRHKVAAKDVMLPEASEARFQSPDFDLLVCQILEAHRNRKSVIVMMGAHVIKVGMSLLIVDLLKKGIITHIAMNGAGPIHDFELAYAGATSEYVEESIQDGSFGVCEETGMLLNAAITEGAARNQGMGLSIGMKIKELELPFANLSILACCADLAIPATVHVAIGTDVIHVHPAADGAAIGKTSYEDFKLFSASVSNMDGGVLLNVGSAVMLPEVFLKALSISRNLGCHVQNITTANFDMLEHYRPTQNVVLRPTSNGGTGLNILGRHEETIPSLHRRLIQALNVE